MTLGLSAPATASPAAWLPSVAWPTARPAASSKRTDATDLESLLCASARGDHAAFRKLYDESAAQLYAVIRRAVWIRGEADELLQEVYVKIWLGAASFDASLSHPLTWMSRIARNHAVDHLRRCASRSKHETPIDPGSTDEAAAIDQIADPGPTPEQQCENRRSKLSVEQLLAGSSVVQRQVLVLSCRDGLSQAEIAEHLAVPMGTVKSWMRRGLQSLRDSLEQPNG